MQWHKNIILISSAVYAVFIVVMAIIFGMWHNSNLQTGFNKNLVFLLLIFLATTFSTWFYFIIFNVYRKENRKNEPELTSIVGDIEKEVEEQSEENVTVSFDKDAFISGINPIGKQSLKDFGETLLQNLANKLEVVQGIFYVKKSEENIYEPVATYAYYSNDNLPIVKVGEALPGQALKDKRVLIIQNIPEDYISVLSGLGNGKPKSIIMIPVLSNNEPIGLIEVAVFKSVDAYFEPALKELGAVVGKTLIKLTK